MGFFQKVMGFSGSVAEVGEFAASPLHVSVKPVPADGHYKVSHRMVLINAQAANSRLFEIRNPTAGKLLILLNLRTLWISSNAHTTFIEDSLDCYKLTGFTGSSTTATVALTSSLKRTGMAADIALCKGATVAGVAAGMTGFTSTKDTGPFSQHPRILPTAVMAATETAPRVADIMQHINFHEGLHPFVFAQNEGLLIENRVLLGAAAGSSVYFDASYAIADAY